MTQLSWDELRAQLIEQARYDISEGDKEVGAVLDENVGAIAEYLGAIARLMLAQEIRHMP
jgi:hypothetical protein